MTETEKKDPRPLCKLCNTRHWSHESHAWEKKAKSPVQPGLNKKPKKKSSKKKAKKKRGS